ncbi:hypothetical protein C2G38_2192914 [Gigaspora rosea]|uniref:Uncharacterized protein n=1 Tax=Gigaspora rosea TaxID=44941 RepID=A0A397V7G8_9GLOM|nr:hypothetical protein C2G38_2192914 [Gigaspora rosea]
MLIKERQVLEPIEPISTSNNNMKNADLELDPIKFEQMIENIEPQLEGFFGVMVNAIIPTECSAYSINEAKKTIVGLCYQMAVGSWFVLGATWEAIDTISSLGYSACAKTVEEFRKKIQKEHVIKIEEHFVNHKNLFYVYNIDNYHTIHENRRPDTTSTSTAKHFATCVAKPVFECPSVPLIFNGVSVHNPANVKSSRICWYLLKRYTGVFDISYANNIIERKEERSMNGLKLVGFKEQHLHSLQDYISALNMILLVNNKTNYLTGYVAPIVADWPSQIFIRKALHMQTLPNLQNSFSCELEAFLPIAKKIGKKASYLENKLIIRAHTKWMDKIKSKITEKFGQNCKDIEYRMMIDLLENLIPSTLDIYELYFIQVNLMHILKQCSEFGHLLCAGKGRTIIKPSCIFVGYVLLDGH